MPSTRSRARTDLKIGQLESEKNAHGRQLEEARATATTFQTKYEAEAARAATAEEALQKANADRSRQALQITNLQQALDKAHERESTDAKKSRLEDRHRDRALDLQTRTDSEEKKHLEDRLRCAEAKLEESQAAVRRLEAETGSSLPRPKHGVRSLDPSARLMALENECMALKAENSRLQSASSHASTHKSAQFDRRDFGSEQDEESAQSATRRRRPRSSSVSGPSSHSEASLARLQAQLTDLQSVYEETKSDLAKAESKVTKAEREALKASNETIAAQRQGERQVSELKEQLREIQQELRWRREECESIARELEDCRANQTAAEKRALQADEARAKATSAQNEAGNGHTAILDMANAKAEDADRRCRQIQEELQSTQERLQDAQSKVETSQAELARTQAEFEKAQQQASSDVAKVQEEGPTTVHGDGRVLRELRRSLAQVTSERDTLKVEVGELEDEVDRLQAGATSSFAERDATTSLETIQELKRELEIRQSSLDSVESERSRLTEELSSRETDLQRALEHGREADKRAQALEEELQVKTQEMTEAQEHLRSAAEAVDAAEQRAVQASSHDPNDESDAMLTEAQLRITQLEASVQELEQQLEEHRQKTAPLESEEELQELRHQVEVLRSDLAEKDATIEQADALAEEDVRQFRQKEAEVKQLSDEIQRLRQKAREATLEMEVLRASQSGEDDVDSHLTAIRAELDSRDRELMQLRQTLKARDDVIDSCKRQLKRIGAWLSSNADADTSLLDAPATPRANGHSHGAAGPATPIAKLLKGGHFFATPGGRQLQRSFDDDLLDDVELLRASLEERQQERDFAKIEEQMRWRRLEAEVEAKTLELAQIKAQLVEQEQLWAQGQQTRDTAEQEKRALDDEERQRSATRCAELEEHVAQLRDDLQAAHKSLQNSQEQLVEARRQHESTASELQSSRQRFETAGELSQQLESKRRKLLEVEANRSALRDSEKLGETADDAIKRLQLLIQSEAQSTAAWEANRDVISQALDQCRNWIGTATTMAHAKPSHSRSVGSASTEELVQLQAKIDELQGRILRREEQIGSQQNKIQALSTQLQMARDDYDELAEQNVDAVRNATQLRENLERAVQQNGEETRKLRAEIEEASEALRDATTQLEEETRRANSLEAQLAQVPGSSDPVAPEPNASTEAELAESQARIDALLAEIETHKMQIDELHEIVDEREEELARQGAAQQNADNAPVDDIATLQAEREHLEAKLSMLEQSHAEELSASRDDVEQLRDQLDTITAQYEEAKHANETAARDLQQREDSLVTARGEAEHLQEKLARLEEQTTAQLKELTDLKERSAGEQSSITSERMTELECDIERLQTEAEATARAHQNSITTVESELEAAKAAASHAEEGKRKVQMAMENVHRIALEESRRTNDVIADLEARHAEAEADSAKAAEAHREQQQALQDQIDSLQSRLEDVQRGLEDRQEALLSAEAAIAERDEALKTRHNEYWSLKEELAELQEQAERSRAQARTVEALEEQLEQAEGEINRLRDAESRLEAANNEVEASRRHLEEAERDNVVKSSELADLRGELKRRKAANRFNEEELQSLKMQRQTAEESLQQSQTALTRAEAQLESARAAEGQLRLQLEESQRQAQDSLAAAAKNAASNGAKASDDVAEELAYLNSRVSELEQELETKADEIENADERILEGLKENKKLASKVKTLQKQLAQASQVSQATTSTSPPASTQPAEASTASPATTSPILSRKRSAPEDQMQDAGNSSQHRAARGVFIPSPAKPIAPSPAVARRAIAGSPVKSGGLQDRTNTARLPAAASIQDAEKDGLFKFHGSANGNANSATKVQAVEGKATAENGATGAPAAAKRTLGGARGGAGDLMAALQAKRKLNAGR